MIQANRQLITLALSLLFSTSLFGDSEAMPVYDLEAFVVVAPNVFVPENSVSRDFIQSAKPVDLAAILSSKLPAAALTRKGPLAGDIVLRGFTRDNVNITVDGNKTFCACPNRMDPPAFHVSSQQIEGVRVRTGPFSVDQGGSVGGTIAVQTTLPGDEAFARAYGYAGSFDYYAGGLTVGTPLGEAAKLLGGLYYQEGGVYKDGSGRRFTELPGLNYRSEYLDATAFEVVTAETKLTYDFGESSHLTVNYAYQDASDVLYPGLRMDAPTDTMNRLGIAISHLVAANFADRVEASLAFSHVDHDMRDSFRTSFSTRVGNPTIAARGYFMRTEATSTYVGARAEFSKTLDNADFLRYGIDLSQRYWDADNIIGIMQRNDMLPDTLSEKLGFWGVYEHRSGPWALETGLRLDLAKSEAREDISFLHDRRPDTTSNRQDDVLPSLYALLSRELGESTEAYAGLGYASRMPDPQERYMNLDRPDPLPPMAANPDWVGNPDLDPVHNLEFQTGIRWETEAFDAELSAFHAWLDDHIYLVDLPVDPSDPETTSYDNIDARLYGMSAQAGWQASESLRLEAGLAWQRGVKESRPVNATNDVLGEVPPLRGRLAAILTQGKFTARAEAQFQDTLDRVDPDLGEREVSGWGVVNLVASYQFSESLSLSAGVDNLFDKTYAVSNAFVRDPFRAGIIVNEPGRFVFLRAGLEF
jgi:iron complex outermembrane receptor protein